MKSREKQFIARKSLLTELQETKGFRAIYNLVLVLLGLQILRLLVISYLDNGSLNFGQRRIFHSFATFHNAFAIWSGMQVFVLLKYCTFKAQIFTRRFIRKIGPLLMFDIVNDVLTYFYCFLLLPVTVIMCVIKYDLAVADSTYVMFELMRFMMKLFAFIETIKERKDVPAFGNYVYYLFAPTFVYRDEYPRTEKIRWKFAATCFLEAIGVMFCCSLLADVYMPRGLINFGRAPITWSGLVDVLASGIFIGIVIFIVSFYGLFHAWMNGMAELLRFADRKFYEDWWTATNIFDYFRRWNLIVHDFIHFYVYRGFRRTFSHTATVIVVFLVSGCLHDVIAAVCFRFVYPVFLFLFFVQLLYVCPFENQAVGNCFFLFCFTIGIGVLSTLYLAELFARKNCVHSGYFWIPVSWWCNGIV